MYKFLNQKNYLFCLSVTEPPSGDNKIFWVEYHPVSEVIICYSEIFKAWKKYYILRTTVVEIKDHLILPKIEIKRFDVNDNMQQLLTFIIYMVKKEIFITRQILFFTPLIK